jgi:hypothetical protein
VKRITAIAALISAAALVSGCGIPGPTWKPGRPAVASPSGVPGVTVGTPPPGVGAKAWSADVRWTAGGFSQLGLSPYPQDPVTALQMAEAHIKYGVVATIGDVVVVPSVAAVPVGGGSSSQLSLRFLNSRTGAVVADRQLPGASFEGIRARTVAGKPVVEARYIGSAGAVNVLFDAAGDQLWTSPAKSLTDPPPPSVGDMAAGGLFASGYRLLFTPDPNTGSGTWNRGGFYDVLDVADRKVMTIPVNVSIDQANPAAGIRNSVSLAGGYAVVAKPERAADPDTTVTTDLTVYDLAAGAKKVATVSVPTIKPANGDAPARAVAAIGGKLLVTWMGPTQPPAQREFHEGPYQDLFVAVLDAATGRNSTPVDTGVAPAGLANPPTAFVDPTSSTVVEYGIVPTPYGVGLAPPIMFAVDLAHGTVTWKKQGQDVLQPISAHNGVIYGVQSGPAGQPRFVEVGAVDGKRIVDGFTVAPLAFTADGTPVFVEAKVALASPSPSRSTAPLRPPTVRPSLPPDFHWIEVWAPAH